MRNLTNSPRSTRGQALAEFALILPLLLGLVGAGVDFSRAFAASMTVETAARNAAEAAAYEATTPEEAQTKARAVVCTETQHLPGFVPGPGGVVTACTAPTVTVAYSRDEDAPGANPVYPLVKATVTASLGFDLTVPWPFLPDGTITLTSTDSFEILQGR